MKKLFYIILIFLITCPYPLFAQSKGEVGFSLSIFNQNQPLRSATHRHTTTTEGLGHLSFLLSYRYDLLERLSLESGILFSQQIYEELPNLGISQHLSKCNLWSIPIGIRMHQGRYLFANVGTLLDFGSQAGVGAYFGFGAKADSATGLGMYVNPYLEAHSLLPFAGYATTTQYLALGIKIGITYRLGNVMNFSTRGF